MRRGEREGIPVIIRVCPYCGQEIAHGLKSCLRCGWKLKGQAPVPAQITATMTLMFFLLALSASCAYQSFADKHGDESGYGAMALVEGGILIATIVWLGVVQSFRSSAPKYRKAASIRAAAGVALSSSALLLALTRAQAEGLGANDWARVGLLAVSGLVLMVTSSRTLRSKP